VDTDALVPTIYLHQPPSEYSKHCLETVRTDLAANVKVGDVVIAGRDFGRGSSREHAALALKYLGIRGVIAVSVAPIMKRNLFNIGVPVFEHPDIPHSCDDGDEVELTTFKLVDPHRIAAITDLVERTETIRFKERRFGRGWSLLTPLSSHTGLREARRPARRR